MKVRHLLKKLSICTLVLSLVSCGFLGNDSKAQEGYVVQPNYDHPKFKELDAAFAKQEHRFEIDRCEFTYNDQAFFIGDSYDKIIEIFGEPDDKFIHNDGDFNLKYKKLKLIIWFSKENNKVISFSMRMSNYKGHKDTPYKIIKFRKVPYHLDMTLNEFSKLCDLEHYETLGHKRASFYIIGEKKCGVKNTSTEIGSIPRFKNVGGGHMSVSGEFIPENSDVIKSFVISSENN